MDGYDAAAGLALPERRHARRAGQPPEMPRLPRIAWLLLSVAVLMLLANNVQNSGASQFSSSSSSGMVPPVGTPSPIDFHDSIPKPVNKTACLITKWSAVWVVHPDKTRSHVSFPTPGCEIKAAPVDKLEAYNKAFNGEGDYFLGTEKSRVACEKLRGCGSPAPTQNGAAASTPSSTSVEPALGWGGGVPAGGAWMANSTLRFNAPAAAAFPTLRLEPGEPLLLVFGGASVNDMLKNWVLHVQKLKMPFVVACMDESLFELAAKSNHPAVLMREDASGGESKVSTRWK